MTTCVVETDGLVAGLTQIEYQLYDLTGNVVVTWAAVPATQIGTPNSQNLVAYLVQIPQPSLTFMQGAAVTRVPGDDTTESWPTVVTFSVPCSTAPITSPITGSTGSTTSPVSSGIPASLVASTGGSGIDDLLVYCRLLLVSDSQMKALFTASLDPATLAATLAAGEPPVAVTDPENRALAAYPRLVLSGEEGEQRSYGDALPKFFVGQVRVEIVTRQSDACPDPLETLTQIKGRTQDLLLGNPLLALPGVRGQRVSPSWLVSACHQVRPTGRLPVTDPEFKRHLTTYDVMLNRATL